MAVELISNLHDRPGSSETLEPPNRRLGQPFNAGSREIEYDLHSIGVCVTAVSGGPLSTHLTATLHSAMPHFITSQEIPADVLCKVSLEDDGTVREALQNRVFEFVAPNEGGDDDCPALEKYTGYLSVLSPPADAGNTFTLSIARVGTDEDELEPDYGWTITDHRVYRQHGRNSWNVTSGGALAIRVF